MLLFAVVFGQAAVVVGCVVAAQLDVVASSVAVAAVVDYSVAATFDIVVRSFCLRCVCSCCS